jgi:hypothetical protein
VKFIYNGGKSTHFCPVDHIDGDQVYVFDVFDGQVKNASIYGGVKAWATYKNLAAEGDKPMVKQEAVAILDAFYGRFAGRKVKQSELDEYVPVFLAGKSDEFFSKAWKFDEVKKYIGSDGSAASAKQVAGGQLIDALQGALKA